MEAATARNPAYEGERRWAQRIRSSVSVVPVPSSQLTDLEQVAVGIAEEGSYLATAINGLGQECGAPATEELVRLPAVLDTEYQLGAHRVGVGRRYKGDRRLVRRRIATVDQQEPVAQKLQYDRRAVLPEDRGIEHLDIPISADVGVSHHE
jgi:hypothetical protein